MSKNIEQIKNKIVPVLKEAGVVRSSLFGSVVRGETTKVSDIDILVDLPRGKTLFDLACLELDFEEALGKDVDVVTYRSISPLLKDTILSVKFHQLVVQN